MLLDIVRRFSNSRSCTYKLHVKEKNRIEHMENFVQEAFIKSVYENQYFFNHYSDKLELYKQDILVKLPEFKDNQFDVSITSPPYGDNATTVTYGQFSSLPLKWIHKNDLHLEGWELNNYSVIDSKSMGGVVKSVHLTEQQLDILIPYVSEIRDIKQRKVYLFFNDYFHFLDELCRVTDKYIVMTLGNRRVDNKLINLTDITYKYLEMNNFTNISKMAREIPQKRIPRTTSNVADKSVLSMSEEYVIVHKKKMF
jgi:site-specific DNA-methyltransferase (cytosine-N4-specific)